MHFDKQAAYNILKSRKLITTPGKKKIQVASEPNFVEGDGERPDQFLIGLKAMAPDQAKSAKESYNERDYDGAVGYGSDNPNTSLTASKLVGFNGEIPDLPKRGEYVDVEMGFVEGQDGSQVLRPVEITRRDAEDVSQTLDLDGEEEEATEATSGEDLDEAGS